MRARDRVGAQARRYLRLVFVCASGLLACRSADDPTTTARAGSGSIVAADAEVATAIAPPSTEQPIDKACCPPVVELAATDVDATEPVTFAVGSSAFGAPGAAKVAALEDVDAATAGPPIAARDVEPDVTEPVEVRPTEAAFAEPVELRIPDVELLDQDGKKRRLRTDLVQGSGVVVMNFVFTSCTTICPPLTANFAKLQQRLAEGRGRDARLITLSIDPQNDTPERMKAWGATFGARPGWTFLTGAKPDVDLVLKSLGVFSSQKEAHTPLVLIGDEASGRWRRVDGLAPPETLAAIVEELLPAAPDDERNSAARAYFTDVELVDHEGRTQRLYTDLIRDKIVVVDCFFAECTGVCPVLARNLAAIQEAAGDRLGRDVFLLSVSVDSERDTPERLAEYAATCEAKPGWFFLSGSAENVRLALHKLGYAVESREQHKNHILIGNDKTGLWKKANGLAQAAEVVRVFESVLNDDGG